MIKNILFALDDTLFDFHAAEKRAIKRTFETLGVPATEEVLKRYSQINSEYWKMLEKGLITRDGVKVGRFEKLFAETGYDFVTMAQSPRYAPASSDRIMGLLEPYIIKLK